MGGIPSQYTVDLDLVSPVDLTGIPSSFEITSLPKIQIGMDPITVNPLDVSVRIKEVPSLRTHVPAHYTVGFSIFGFQLACGQRTYVLKNVGRGERIITSDPLVPNQIPMLIEIC